MTDVPTHSDKYDDLELAMLSMAVESGMTYEDACSEYDSLQTGNDGAYTARIQSVMKKFFLRMVEVNS